MSGGGPPEEAPPRPEGPFFAVKTTLGFEQEVADAICARARKEGVPVCAVLAPQTMRGYVFVEGADYNRLTNLVAAVRHTRGVVIDRKRPGVPSAAEIPFDEIRHFLDGEERPLPEEILEEIAGGPFRAQPKEVHARKVSKARKGRDAAGSPNESGGEGPVPRGTHRTADSGPAPGHPPAWLPLALNLAIAAPVLVIAVGLLVAPRIFWDQFLLPYFWAAIDADANNVGGSAETYNIVDTLAYALILVPSLLFIWRVLEAIKVKVDTRFVVMLTPFLLLGGAARALEDSVYFAKPLTYAFISPIIYVAEGLLVIALVVASWWVVRVLRTRGRSWGLAAWSAAFAPGALALAYFQLIDTRFVTAPLPVPVLMTALACGYLAGLVLVNRPAAPEVHHFVAIAGVLLVALAGYLIARWCILGGWFAGPAQPATTHLGEAPVILGVAAVATSLTFVGLWALSARLPRLEKVLSPVNALMAYGQFLDGTATFWGIDFFGYQEKHVLPSFLISLTGTALVMFPLKLAFLLFVFYLIDIAYRKELYDASDKPTTLVGLLKLTVLALGMGPGTRDMLRLVMGV